MATNVGSLAEFDNIQADLSPKTKLIVLFFFDPRDGTCSRVERYVNLWIADANYKDRVLFLKCNKERSNQDIFEKYNVEEIPTFLFIKNNEQVAPAATGPPDDIETVINDLLNGKK